MRPCCHAGAGGEDGGPPGPILSWQVTGPARSHHLQTHYFTQVLLPGPVPSLVPSQHRVCPARPPRPHWRERDPALLSCRHHNSCRTTRAVHTAKRCTFWSEQPASSAQPHCRSRNYTQDRQRPTRSSDQQTCRRVLPTGLTFHGTMEV